MKLWMGAFTIVLVTLTTSSRLFAMPESVDVETYIELSEEFLTPDNRGLVDCLKKAKKDYHDALDACDKLDPRRQPRCYSKAIDNYNNEVEACLKKDSAQHPDDVAKY